MKPLTIERLLAVCLAAAFSCSTTYATEVALTGDAHVSSSRGSTMFGTLANLYVGNNNAALLQFDLSTLPAAVTASQISRATLTVFVNRVNTPGVVTLYPITSSWIESTVTYNTQPTYGTTAAGSFTATTAGQYITVDVTTQVQNWITNGNNNGLELTASTANILLDSKENDETGHAARLDITITSAGATGPQGPQGVMGPQGSAGSNGTNGTNGSNGATGATGTIGIVTNWSSATAYTTGQVVFCAACSSNGSSYIALAGNTNVDPPTHSASWQLIAQVGSTGAQGSQGATGPAGPFVGGTYSASVDYPAGTVVVNSAITYVALQANGPSTSVITPGSNVTYWLPTTGSGSGSSATPDYIYLQTSSNISFTSGGTFIFPSLTYSSGLTYNSSTGEITVPTAGVYDFDFYVSGGQEFAIYVNGSSVSQFYDNNQAARGHGSIPLNAGDKVTLVSPYFTNSSHASNSSLTATLSLVSISGVQGATGATGTIGTVTNWSSVTAYTAGQVVFCTSCSTNGSSYIAISTNTNSDPPTHSSNWHLIAQAGSTGAAGTNGVGLTNGSAAGQVYLTGSSPFAPQVPQTITGDVTISSSAVTTIGANKVTGGKIGTGSNGIAATNLNTTGTASSSTYLRGDFQWTAPPSSNVAFGGTLANGSTVSATAATLFVVTDSATITLPLASAVTGLHLIFANATITGTQAGFTVAANGGDTIADTVAESIGASIRPFTALELYSDGVSRWYAVVKN